MHLTGRQRPQSSVKVQVRTTTCQRQPTLVGGEAKHTALWRPPSRRPPAPPPCPQRAAAAPRRSGAARWSAAQHAVGWRWKRAAGREWTARSDAGEILAKRRLAKAGEISKRMANTQMWRTRKRPTAVACKSPLRPHAMVWAA